MRPRMVHLTEALLVVVARSGWVVPVVDLVRSTEQGLANDLVEGEVSREYCGA
ncbi:hypothetical protein SMA5143A_8211 [Streptomyces sp. MA5143a]|nr:hypothetical protein SMA5143A_8211 [Streptomyces sp. MA5143a]